MGYPTPPQVFGGYPTPPQGLLPYSQPAPIPNEGGGAPNENENEEEEGEGGFEEGVSGAGDPNRVMEFTKKGAPVDVDMFSKFSHWLGSMARERVPITITDWRTYLKENTNVANNWWSHIKVKNS